jgi:ATP-dependent RNA helicase RhlE
MGFNKLGLSDRVLEGVQAAGYTVPTPIQTLAIRPVLAGRDLIAGAQTGTGKTAAFVLPILHKLSLDEAGQGSHRKPRALVLTPTRELAQQVQLAASAYGRFLPLTTASIYGGVGMDAQVKQLRRGVDIVVATPGRLLDHMHQRSIDLSRVQVLVLDEADRMLDMGFIRDVRKIIDAVPKQRQTLLFSATISPEINDLAADILQSPQTVEVGERRNPAETVTQHFYAVARDLKTDVLVHAMEAEHMGSVLVFSRTKHGADKITRRLARKGINAVAIHSNRTQGQRERALEGFKRGEFRVLVATDIAARGIDVTGISHVINYDVPQYAEDYIHRIGRTGRAGATGDAITFVSREEKDPLHRIERFIGKRFTVDPYPGAPTQASQPASAGESTPRGARGQSRRGPARPRTPERRDARDAHSKQDDGHNHGRSEERQDHGQRQGSREPHPGQGTREPSRAHAERTRPEGQEARAHTPGQAGQSGSGRSEGQRHPQGEAGRRGRRRQRPGGTKAERKSSPESWSNYPRHPRGRR